MKPRQPVKNSIVDRVRLYFGSTTVIGLSIPFLCSTKRTEDNLDASIKRADETIAKLDETRAQTDRSMEKSAEVLAEVEANNKRFGNN